MHISVNILQKFKTTLNQGVSSVTLEAIFPNKMLLSTHIFSYTNVMCSLVSEQRRDLLTKTYIYINYSLKTDAGLLYSDSGFNKNNKFYVLGKPVLSDTYYRAYYTICISQLLIVRNLVRDIT